MSLSEKNTSYKPNNYEIYGNDIALKPANSTLSTPTMESPVNDIEESSEFADKIDHIFFDEERFDFYDYLIKENNELLDRIKRITSERDIQKRQCMERIEELKKRHYTLDQQSEQKKVKRMMLMWLAVIIVFEFILLSAFSNSIVFAEDLIFAVIDFAIMASIYYWINFFIYKPIFRKAAEENQELRIIETEIQHLQDEIITIKENQPKTPITSHDSDHTVKDSAFHPFE